MMTHCLSPQAEADLDDIWFYIAKESGEMAIADRIVERLTECFFFLASHPYIGRSRDEDLRPGLRSFPAGNYVILYRIEGNDMRILHVIHGSRDIPALLRTRH